MIKRAYQTLTTRGDKGFTLIELLVVIAIIAVLAALILAALSSAQKGSRDSKRRSDVSQLKTALVQYAADFNGAYPTAAVGVNVNTIAALQPNYISAFPASPGGSGAQAFYLYFGSATSFCLSVQSERNTAQYIGASPAGQFNDKGAACAAADSY